MRPPARFKSVKISRKQVKQAFPMPFGTWLVKNTRALWKCKTMLGAGVPFQSILELGGIEVRLHGIDHFFWRVAVDFGTCKVHLGTDPISQEMRRIRGFCHQIGAIDRCAALESPGEVRARRQYVGPAHAIAHSAERCCFCGGL